MDRPLSIESGRLPAKLHLFGLTGSGKSYVALLLAREYGYYIYEADEDFTPRMRAATARGETFTQDMRDEFFDVVAGKFLQLSEVHPLLVMPQAAYHEKHRELLRRSIPGLIQVMVDAEDTTIEKRIMARSNEVTVAYSRRVKAFFDMPGPEIFHLRNNAGDEETLMEFQKWLMRHDPF